MKQKNCLLWIAFIFLLLITGCWDKKELNELAVATGISIDKAENGYKLSVQIVNPIEISPQASDSGITPVTVRSEKGETMYETMRRLSLTNSRSIYTSHLRLLVISEEVAKEGIDDILDYLSRERDLRADFIIIIAKESKAEDILKVQTITERISANALYNILETSEKVWAGTVSINLGDLLDMLTTPGRSPVLSGIEVKGDIKIGETQANTETTHSPAGFNYFGLGVFQDNKLVGWLNEDEGKGYNYITDNIHNTVGHINCPDDGNISIEVMHSKTKQRAKATKDSKPNIELDVRVEANIGEADCSVDLENPNEISKLEKLMERRITEIIDKTIDKVQEEYKTDIFGFGEKIYRTYPKIWEEIKGDWEEHFANLAVQVNVNVNINELGTIGNPIKQDIKEHQ